MRAGVLARRALSVGIAVAVTAALTVGSRITVSAHDTPDAMLRLAWAARPERVEQCRTLGEEELAALPAHMRQQVVCTGVTAQYRAEIFRDGRLLAADDLRGGGLRNDRQLYHYRELRIPGGASILEVRVTRTVPAIEPDDDSADADDEGSESREESDADDAPRSELAAREALGRRRRRADEIPASLQLTETVTLAPREVILVSYDRIARRLHFVRGNPPDRR